MSNNTFACEKCGAAVQASAYDVSKNCPVCGHNNNVAAGRARGGGSGGGKIVFVGAALALTLGVAGFFLYQTEAEPPAAAEDAALETEVSASSDPVPAAEEPTAKAVDDPPEAKPAAEAEPAAEEEPAAETPTSSVRMGALQVTGRLSADVVRRILQRNTDRFSACHAAGLKRDPELAGSLSIRFVIGRDGAVVNAGNGGSDLSDSAVVSCAISTLDELSFPKPSGGIVVVALPLKFTPG